MKVDTYYLNIAETASERSKCVSLKVGCVLVINDKIVSTGLNGTHRGEPNCCDHFPEGNGPDHSAWSQENEIHAEMNAILQAERSLQDAVAYTTISPCDNCLKHLAAVGVTKIYYRTKYWRLSDEDIQRQKSKYAVRKNPVYLLKEGEDKNV